MTEWLIWNQDLEWGRFQEEKKLKQYLGENVSMVQKKKSNSFSSHLRLKFESEDHTIEEKTVINITDDLINWPSRIWEEVVALQHQVLEPDEPMIPANR